MNRYSMFVSCLKTGASFGIVFGLLATLCDALFMLTAETYITSSYPISIFIFNITFWSGAAFIMSLFQWFFLRQADPSPS